MFNLNLIFYLLIIASLIGLGIIIYRKIPALANLSEEEMTILERKKGIIQRIQEVDYKQHWLNFIIALEKFLRRVKIVFLKIENLLTKWIGGLRGRSQVMTQKSREWIKQREMKRRKDEKSLADQTKGEVSIKINKVVEEKNEPEIEEDELPISELKKPIQEEQKWIDLIVEDPKNITAYKFLGLLYWKQHNYPDAKASLEMAVKLGSKDSKVKEVLEELKKLNVE
jgi:tetratricopeptide (TPR) repeat protein